jgi:hypothetical protein
MRNGEVEEYRRLPGDRGEIMRAAWGATDNDIVLEIEERERLERLKNPHKFVRKLRKRYRLQRQHAG